VKKKKAISTIPLLEEEELEKLAKEFASNITEDEVSVAALQGYLLKNKARPRECVKEVAEWIVQERETKEKIKKEKEEVSLGIPNRCTLGLTYPIQREQKQKEEREKREKEKKKEEDKKAEEAAAEAAAEARRALRKARRAAAAAVVSATPVPATEALPTPPAEAATPAEGSAKVAESESSSTETTTDDTDSESDEAEVATIKEPATKDKKEKWVSVKQPSTSMMIGDRGEERDPSAIYSDW
jgi:chaperone BCS1